MNLPVIFLSIAVILCSVANMRQDTKINDLTQRIHQLEQSK